MYTAMEALIFPYQKWLDSAPKTLVRPELLIIGRVWSRKNLWNTWTYLTILVICNLANIG